MKKIILIVAMFLFALACQKSGNSTEVSGEVKATSKGGAIDFALKDLSGKTVQLSDYRGKPVLVVFFATWCGPCRMEIPHLIELHREGITILAINVRESGELVKKFIENNNIPYRILLDSSGSLSARFRVNGIPTTLFINPDGTLYRRIEGYTPTLKTEVLSWAKRKA